MNPRLAVEMLAEAARHRRETPTLIPRAVALGETAPPADPLRARLQRSAEGLRRSFWQEMHLELRRHAGHERLPVDFRGSLRGLAQRAHARASRSADAAAVRLPRRLLREPVDIRLPADLEQRAREEAVAAGLDPTAPMVVLELRNRPDIFADAIDLLVARGLNVVRIGEPTMSGLVRSGVVDLTGSPRRTPLLELFLLSHARFIICGGSDLQCLSYLVNRPSLTLNGIDPFTLYPVRAHGLCLVRATIDLDTGRELTLADMLADAYFRNQRHHGHREHTAADVTAAVAEMIDGVERGWRDSDAQARYRAFLTEEGTRLAASVRHVAKWGPDAGFLGDGRLARAQADRLS